MKEITEEKYLKLKEALAGYERAAVAFSGGVDSTLLLKVCHDVIGDGVTAVTAVMASVPVDEKRSAEEFCEANGISLEMVEADQMSLDGFVNNGPDRCYYCKRHLFEKILKEHPVVFDGSNADDDDDFRPGARALSELGVISPLKEAGLTKDEIREISRELGLETWDKPAMACLASRIPYGDRITEENMRMIDESESYLRELGFTQVRVRTHGKIARIEVPAGEMDKLLEKGKDISDKLLKTGYDYVTLDLKGYRMGSMNEVIDDGKK